MKAEINVFDLNMLLSVCDVTLKCNSGDNCEARWINKSFICFKLPWDS